MFSAGFLVRSAAALLSVSPVQLSVIPVHGPHLATSRPIVGRAVCGDRAHLLTTFGELIEITTPRRPAIEVHVSEELGKRPDLWGLACLTDGSLWTLESGHSLVRLTREAGIGQRIPLQLPWITLFGNGDRLLFQALPTVAGVPVLASAAPTALEATRSWPGPVGRAGTGSSPSIARNLLRCGLRAGRLQPCWFVDEGTIVMSDGTAPWSFTIPASHLAGLDSQMPIWDAAATDESRIWVLAMSGGNVRRAADTVILMDRGGRSGQIRLPRTARLIVFAAYDRCTLLLSTGDFVEVHAS